MNDLLKRAVDAHGGLARWAQISKLSVKASIGGGLWYLKGKPDALANVEITADPHHQHVEYAPFGEADHHSVYEPAVTAIVAETGEVISSHAKPRGAFAGHTVMTPWEDHHLIYFSGYAMWTYLTTPFLLTLPGFQTEEVEPWEEDGEIWRRLKAVFPADVESHSTEQTFYFDATGILRRHDYSADVLGGTSSANYALAPQTFDGIVFPTQRRIYAVGPDNRPVLDRVAVAIDFHAITAA